MIPSLETERMWARPVRLEDAEQVQKIFYWAFLIWRRGGDSLSKLRNYRKTRQIR